MCVELEKSGWELEKTQRWEMCVALEKRGWELERTQSDGRCVHGDSRTEERLGTGNGQTR